MTRRVALPIALVVTLLAGGCQSTFRGEWGANAKYVGFDPNTLNRGGAADFSVLVQISKIYYERIANRRYNSKATFDDPALREYFQSPSAFADYYASLSEALERANFESHRPTSVRLLRIERTVSNEVGIEVRFTGENRLPLRWWRTRVKRADRWQFSQGRWWIIPGKV